MRKHAALWLSLGLFFSCHPAAHYDTIIKGGTIYDGSGSKPFTGDIAIRGDTIAAIGDLSGESATNTIDATNKAVSPGFIDLQSQSMESLIQDGRSLGAIKQGVTLEIFGEGSSEGPLTDTMKRTALRQQGDIKFNIEWTTLKDYLEFLQKKGVSTNVASFVGAATIRENLLDDANRAPDSAEQQKMNSLVRKAMEDGALGIGSALIYAPGAYAKTPELIELCKAAAPYGGVYISHIRSEGNRLLEGADELIRISKEAHIPAIIYHLKAAGRPNWNKMDSLIAKIDSARKAGLDISACMYTYTAGATGFDAAMPPAIQEGGLDKWIQRLEDPAIRKKLIQQMRTPTKDWENLYLGAGADNIICTGFKQDSLKYLTGKRLSEIARMRHTTPEETIIDLVIADHSRVEVIYFLMSEENVRKEIRLPYMAFGSDEASMAPEGVFLKSSCHPRAYGNFARLLGHYVRDEKLIPLEEAVHKLSGMPAGWLHLKKRGLLRPGNYADVVVFDPATVKDNATYENPHQLSTGVTDVFVNGTQVLKAGEHTGAKPGRAVFGAGYKTP
ncbi:N-acyl-D-amino-acid deacylase family protein [Puia dinghuensis]|uniref:Dihydroorotase n=1 Tax=Puia dinghuensis TaxID=1792502 RepID=A0A8J2UJF4_9BACT|nr:D-aminoacylase [Puia dinghuensis]GGB26095.1 dihydroorotase [Puia dinghuensis]